MSLFNQENPMDGYQVRLTARHAREARRIGGGNMGMGIRTAIEIAHFVMCNEEMYAQVMEAIFGTKCKKKPAS
jgi:hypothetical protein